MAVKDSFQPFPDRGVSCHVFNKDHSRLALSTNNSDVLIYKNDKSGWTLEHTLSQHDCMVTSIDWAHETNRIVTCAQDRNAYVWNYVAANNVWEPELVLLRINRAATFVRWSPKEDKFAVASGAKCLNICSIDKENNWWISKHIRKPIRSTLLSLDWHPSNDLVAVGSTDLTVRVFAAPSEKTASECIWNGKGKPLKFGDIAFEATVNSWVHSVAFSPSGDALAWAAHDSTLSICSGPKSEPSIVTCRELPFLSIAFADEDKVIAAGHDCRPYVFAVAGMQWTLMGHIDKGAQKQAESHFSAMKKFQSMDSRGQNNSGGNKDTAAESTHRKAITSVRMHSGSSTTFSTSGMDGQIVSWPLAGLVQLASSS